MRACTRSDDLHVPQRRRRVRHPPAGHGSGQCQRPWRAPARTHGRTSPSPVGAPVTISLGVAYASAGKHSPAQVLKLADQALYQAKQQGRNRLVAAQLGRIFLGSHLSRRGSVVAGQAPPAARSRRSDWHRPAPARPYPARRRPAPPAPTACAMPPTRMPKRPLIPALDHSPRTDHALEGFAALIGRVEAAAILKKAAVLGSDQRPLDGGLAFTQLDIFDTKFVAHHCLWKAASPVAATGALFRRICLTWQVARPNTASPAHYEMTVWQLAGNVALPVAKALNHSQEPG